ncbi:hypothetical protein ES705_09619 [subsurface metagenome]
MSKRREIILWIGGLLIVLRLFFPIEERVVYRQGAKIVVDNLRIAKRVNVSKTTFQCIGIGVLTGLLFISIDRLKRKKKEEKRD